MLKNLIKSKRSASPRDHITEYVTRILAEKKHEDIKAVISGFQMPQRVVRKSTGEWYIPEVTSVKGGQLRLYAVETKDTIRDAEAEKRWILFSEYAKQNQSIFYLVFPPGVVLQVKQKLERLKIDAHLFQASEA
jgi:hypothetical protein